MKRNRLGSTDLEVSELGFGASSLGSVFRPVSEEDALRCVHTALDLGVNFIDVSPYYGDTLAESVLGRALRGISRDRFVLATKVGRYGDGVFDFSKERIVASVDESLERLGVDTIDLIQCHDIEFCALDQIVEETLPALRELTTTGKVRYVGITGLPLKVFREVISRAEVDSILSYCRYSLNDTGLQSLTPWLREKKVGVISASPLSMGLLTQRGPPDWHPAPAEVRIACRAAAQVCQEHGVDIARLALQFSVSSADVDCTVVGSANAENFARNCEWITAAPDTELVAKVRRVLDPIQNQTWPSGRPENND